MTIDNDTFERWLEITFTRPELDWTLDEEKFVCEQKPENEIACFERVFGDPFTTFELITDEEINRGLWLILGESSDFMWVVLKPPVPWSDRKRVIDLIPTFFESFMVDRCDEHLSHLDRQGQGGRPLNSICYMWWDIFPTWGQSDETGTSESDSAMLSCMERILAIKHIACQENALHGLGHWHMHYPDVVARIVDAYLARNPDLSEELKRYALNARGGCMH